MQRPLLATADHDLRQLCSTLGFSRGNAPSGSLHCLQTTFGRQDSSLVTTVVATVSSSLFSCGENAVQIRQTPWTVAYLFRRSNDNSRSCRRNRRTPFPSNLASDMTNLFGSVAYVER
jgi:hypothetical protein